MPNVARKVIMCDKAGNDLQTFSSTLEAARSFGLHRTVTAISKAIRHGKCAYGYRWRYADEPLYIKPKGTPGKARKIIAVDEQGKEIILPSISGASRKLGIGVSSIESALISGCAAKGYRFHYEGSSPAKSYKHDRHHLGVEVLDEEGNIVGVYDSAKEAAAALGVIPAAVYRCLNPKNKDAKCKGYRLRYKEED